eukprot:gene9295-biopygen3709
MGAPERPGDPERLGVPDAVPAFRNAWPAFRNVPARAHRLALRSVPFRGAPAPPSVPFRSVSAFRNARNVIRPPD